VKLHNAEQLGAQDWPAGTTYLVLGRKRMGKTHCMRRLIEDAGRHHDLVLIHDPAGQYPGRQWRSVAEFRAARDIEKVNLFVSAPVADVARLAVEVALRGQRVLLVIDELDRACNAHGYVDRGIPSLYQGDKNGNLYAIVEYGRHIGRPPNDPRQIYGVTLLGSSRRPAAIFDGVKANLERCYIFRLNSPLALKWVEDACDEQSARAAEQLPAQRFIIYDPSDTSDLSASTRHSDGILTKRKAPRRVKR